jgi:hypothetical protein
MATTKEYREAVIHAARLRTARPTATAARYDAGSDQVLISFSNGGEFRFPAHNVQGLEDAKRRDLQAIEVSPSGFGIYFPRLDVDLDVPELMLGHFGSRSWMASTMGAAGGRSTSAAKRRAARSNGALGGRPKQKHKKAVAGA